MIALPPRDNGGAVVPHDHKEIKDEDEVIRRISEQWVVTDANGRRVSSSMAYHAYKNGGMSVDIKKLIENDGKNSQTYVTTPFWTGSVLFKAGDLRDLDYKVGYNPITAPQPNPYHGDVWGDFPKSKVRKLQSLAIWFVPIPGARLV